MARPDTPENTFPVSALPWASFEGFNLNLQKGYSYLLPIFTLGKFYCESGKTMLPLAVQVIMPSVTAFTYAALSMSCKIYSTFKQKRKVFAS